MKLMKPGWLCGICVVSLSHRNDIGMPYSFSISPWWKNSSNSRTVHSTQTSNGRVCVETSAAWTANSRSYCFESNSFLCDSRSIRSSRLLPFEMFFCSRYVLTLARSDVCLAISVARIIPIKRWRKVLKSSLVKSSKKLYSVLLRMAKDSAAWKLSYTL